MGKMMLLADLVLLSISAVFYPLILLFSTMDFVMKIKVKMFCLLFPLYQDRQRTKEAVAEQTSFLSEVQERQVIGLSGEKQREQQNRKIMFVMLFSQLTLPMIKDTINKQTNKLRNRTMTPNVYSLKNHQLHSQESSCLLKN